MSHAKNYRPEIDGLRTISVMAVLLYHYRLGPVPGGFVGVDVFFVISGYLITSIISAEMKTGKFSLWGFYDRRVRRILPASLLTIIVTGIAGYFILLPSDYAAFGWSAVASAFGAANFHFLWNSGGYFDSAADLMPLLHMWSLGVEEQFYVFWPLILWGVFALSKGSAKAAIAVLAVIIAASFATSVYLTRTDQPVAFYMLHARAWELALGAILVFAPRISNRVAGEAASVSGLALILGSIFLLSSKMPFPGVNALYPCIGAALVIWPKTISPVAEWPLRTRPFTAIGLISFSLYLWHWPVLVLYRHIGIGGMPPVLDRVLFICLVFVLAVLTYRFIETPFRDWRPAYRVSVGWGAASMAAVAAVAFSVAFFDGISSRLPEEVRRLDHFRTMTAGGDVSPCFLTTRSEKRGLEFDPSSCLRRKPGQTNVLVVGDSHAAHLLPALRDEFPKINFAQANASGCRPVLPPEGEKRCVDLMKSVLTDHAKDFDIILISSQWPSSSIAALKSTVERLSKRSGVTVLGPSVEYRDDLPTLLAKSALSGHDLASENVLYDGIQKKSKRIEQMLKETTSSFFSVVDILCPKAECEYTILGVPVFYDKSHFTPVGAKFTVKKLRQAGLFGDEKRLRVIAR